MVCADPSGTRHGVLPQGEIEGSACGVREWDGFSGEPVPEPEVFLDAALDRRHVQWAVHTIRCIGGIIDAVLDARHVPTTPVPGWAAGLQQFAAFLRDNPTGKEMKRKRTHARFIVDLGRELPEEAHRAGIAPAEMSDWTLHHSEEDLPAMPTLGLHREVLHEKLSGGQLRWKDNDLVDMMYLTAAAGYCDYVVGERAHAAHIANASRRLGRADKLHRNLESLVKQL